jgi:hypothetical protein
VSREDRSDGPPPDPEDREALIDVLEAENQRLREEYARVKRTQYERSALALVAVGVVAGVGAVLFPAARTVLFALAGTGVFLGVLTYYLAPEQFFPASLGRAVYETLARNESAIVAELGLQDEFVYVPTDGGVRLYVPQRPSADVPPAEDLADAFVVGPDDTTRGVAFDPTGGALLEEIERGLPTGLGEDPATLTAQLTDALTEQFELAAEMDWELEDASRVTVAVYDPSYGDADLIDHPVASTLATGLARGLAIPVTCQVDRPEDAGAPFLVTCSWNDGASSED